MAEDFVDHERLRVIARRSAADWTKGAADIGAYLAAQVSDLTHREVVGPLKAANGASGVIWARGQELAVWGDPDVPEMAFSVTKSVVSIVAGLAYDDGLLIPDQAVHEVVDVGEFGGAHNEQITWRHLLQQSSQWDGQLWGKPTSVDAQSFREGTEVHGTPPGLGWGVQRRQNESAHLRADASPAALPRGRPARAGDAPAGGVQPLVVERVPHKQRRDRRPARRGRLGRRALGRRSRRVRA
jgi:hypothetical protein